MTSTARRRPNRSRRILHLLLALIALAVVAPSAVLASHLVTFSGDYRTLPASRPSGAHGRGANGDSVSPTISENAKWIAFVSVAPNLGAAHDRSEVFARQVEANKTVLVSRAGGKGGKRANGNSSTPAISGSGKEVAFASTASNLGGHQGAQSIYLRSLARGSTILVSRADGKQGAPADGDSSTPSIDDSAHQVVFSSDASNLPGAVPGVTQIYERDLHSNRTTLVSRASDGSPGNGDSSNPQIAAPGGVIVFQSAATNLGAPGGSGTQIYEHVIATGKTVLVSTSDGGKVANADSITPSVDADGRKVAFASRATNLDPSANHVQNIFVKDLGSGAIILNSRTLGNQGAHIDNGAPANGDSFEPSFPRDGRFVCFSSVATNLGNKFDGFGEDGSVENVYVHDMERHGTFLISRSSGKFGHGGNGNSSHVTCSAGGSLATYQSLATNLSPTAVHGVTSIYRRTIFGGH